MFISIFKYIFFKTGLVKFSSTILLLFLSFPILAQDAVTKLLGKFGAADLSIRKDVDGGRELANLNVTFQNAESPADAIDIGGLMLTDSTAVTNFADQLSDALGHLAARRGARSLRGEPMSLVQRLVIIV